MLASALVTPTIGVKDLAKAKEFYSDVLGLQVITESPQVVVYQSGANSKLQIYQTEFAGTNKATYATWEVGDIASEVEALEAAGITFEQYDAPGVTRDGAIHTYGDGGERAAWFKDPDGNILCLHQ